MLVAAPASTIPSSVCSVLGVAEVCGCKVLVAGFISASKRQFAFCFVQPNFQGDDISPWGAGGWGESVRRAGLEGNPSPPPVSGNKSRFQTITDKVQGNSCLQNATGANG